MRHQRNLLTLFSLAFGLWFAALATADAQITTPARNVQIRTVNFQQQSIELHNFGTQDQPLDGWRFCTHDENEVRRYSSPRAFNGVVLPAGESLFVKYDNNAVAANEFNISSLGNFAVPLDTDGAYAIQFYFQTPFDIGENIADHLQFSLAGADNQRANERNDEAAIGGVWFDENDWVAVSPATSLIQLDDSAATSELHGSSDYSVSNLDIVTYELIVDVLMINGTQGPDAIVLSENAGGLVLDAGTHLRVFDPSLIANIVVNGFGGADEIAVPNVNVPVLINGGFGADMILGSQTSTNDIFGGPGADMILGGAQDDFINSGRGQDVANGGLGNDVLIGGDAADQLFGGPGDDELLGGLGADELLGGPGADVLVGNVGSDRLLGGTGDDELSGLGGPDELFGGDGDDMLRGGEGFDMLNGGSGIDTALDAGEAETGIEQ